MKPVFVAIGAQKCATTWLYSILHEHPEARLAMPEDGDKDTRFFSYFFDRGFAWYETQFPDNRGSGVIGEVSTSYLCSADAPARLADYAPEVKLIACLRHPLDRAFSHHKHEVSRGRLRGEYTRFEKALEKNPMYLEQSRYHLHLQRWLKYFPREQLLVVLFDDIKAEPKKTAETIYRFLGVDSGYVPVTLSQPVNQSTDVANNRRLNPVVRKVKALLVRMGLGNVISAVRKRGLASWSRKYKKSDSQAHFSAMTSETRDRLVEYFREDNAALERLINRDLSSWNRYETDQTQAEE